MDVRLPIPHVPPLWREGLLGLEAAGLLRSPVWRGTGLSRGAGRPVLLIPGFLAGDNSLGLMTHWLRGLGYRTRSAGIRANIDCSASVSAALEARLAEMRERSGQRVAIIGQSRGGVLARALAVRRPDLVSGIVTLGSPQLNPFAINPVVWASVMAVGALGTIGGRGLFNHGCLEGDCCSSFWEDNSADKLPRGVGYVSVYSKLDGVVDWQSCLDPAAAEHVEIRSSHSGMAVHPAGYRVIADSLHDFRRRDARRRPAAVTPLRRAA